MDSDKKIVNFLFEVGTMRKLARMHKQLLLTDDNSDSISSHSFRVAIISWLLAKMEGADTYKSVMMALLHDLGEGRTGDHNYLHKKYVSINNEEVIEDQLGSLPFEDLKQFLLEYEDRQTKEAVIAKDADLLDQILLLREYEHQGNKEAKIWLSGKGREEGQGNNQLKRLKTESAKQLGQKMMEVSPSEWWDNVWTSDNRK